MLYVLFRKYYVLHFTNINNDTGPALKLSDNEKKTIISNGSNGPQHERGTW